MEMHRSSGHWQTTSLLGILTPLIATWATRGHPKSLLPLQLSATRRGGRMAIRLNGSSLWQQHSSLAKRRAMRTGNARAPFWMKWKNQFVPASASQPQTKSHPASPGSRAASSNLVPRARQRGAASTFCPPGATFIPSTTVHYRHRRPGRWAKNPPSGWLSVTCRIMAAGRKPLA